MQQSLDKTINDLRVWLIFEVFKDDFVTLLLENMCKDFVTDYEFVRVNNYKSQLLMNFPELEKLGAAMEDFFAK